VVFELSTGREVGELIVPDQGMGFIDTIAISPDGNRVICGESDGGVVLCDLSAKRVLFHEKLHAGYVNDVAFSPDGTMFASAGGNVIRLRHTAEPEQFLRDFTARPGPVSAEIAAGPVPAAEGSLGCVAFAPDGTRLVGGIMKDASLIVWSITDGQVLQTIRNAHGSPNAISSAALQTVAVTSDGRRIMSVGQTEMKREETRLASRTLNVPMREIRFWDIETGARFADYHGDEDTGWGHAALSPDGKHVAVVDFCRLCIVESATGKTERAIDLPGAWMWRPAFSPDGSLVATPIHNTIGIFERSTGRRLLSDERMPVADVVSAAWSPSGDRIATGHFDGFVRVWDAASGELLWHKLLATIVGRDGMSFSACTRFLAFSSDGKTLTVCGDRDFLARKECTVLAFYDTESGKSRRELFQDSAYAIALAPDERMLVLASAPSGADTHLIGVEAETGKARWTNPAEDQRGVDRVRAMQFERKAPWCLVALQNGTVIRFNALSGREQRRFVAEWRTPEQQVDPRIRHPYMQHASFSDDGRTLVSSQAEWIYVWDVASGALRRKFPSPHRCACSLQLAPDGRTLATSDVHYAGNDTICLCDIETGQQVLALDQGDGRARVLAFSPDGGRLFAGFDLGTGIVRDVRLG
jgi:WD40 repeat protein